MLDNATLKEINSKKWPHPSRGTTPSLDPDWLMMRLAELLPNDAIVVDEGITTTANLTSFLAYRDRIGYFGNASGGIGWGIASTMRSSTHASPKHWRVISPSCSR